MATTTTSTAPGTPARPKSDHIFWEEDNDLVDDLSDREKEELAMALSSPIGAEARLRMENTDLPGEFVKLRGTRRQRKYSHVIFTKSGKAFFWMGKAKVTPEVKAELLAFGAIEA